MCDREIKLVTQVLGDLFKQLKWDTRGKIVDGVSLNHLRFADIILLSNNITELGEMLHKPRNKIQ